jgi:HSP20 family protein
MEGEPMAQSIPVRIYQTEELLMVAAPMPGLEPQDISVNIDGRQLTIMGEERGPGQHDRDMLASEWAIGPYHRELTLPEPVNGLLTNATYGNGVLVLSMPKFKEDRKPPPAFFRLEAVNATRGEFVGRSGSEHEPTSTEQHLRKHAEEDRRAR